MSDKETTQKYPDRIVFGMACAIGAFFSFTLMNVFAKMLSENHSVIEIGFYRNLIASLPFLFMVFVLGRRDVLVIRSKPKAVGARAILGSISLITTFAAFAVMPMADTTAFLFASSLIIPVFAWFFLKEHVGRFRWTAVLVGFVGVLIMVRPTGAVNVAGVFLALSAATMHAILQILLRYLKPYERPETITFYFMTIGTLVLALPLPFVAVRPTLEEVPLLLGVGLSGAAAQWLLSMAFSNAPAAVVTVFNYTGIVWAALFGFMIWGEWPVPAVLVGAFIIIASSLLVIWREARLGKITGARVRAEM